MFRIRQQMMTSQSPHTPNHAGASLHEELVLALSKNHVKRKEITSLRDELSNLNMKLFEQQQSKIIGEKSSGGIVNGDKLNVEKCINCQNYLQKLKQEELHVSRLEAQLENSKKEKVELQNSMADLVQTFDRKKTKDLESQNTAMLQLVDDAKTVLRDELLSVHSKEKKQWDEEYGKLSSELLYTKEEYVKLGEEMKYLEQKMKHEQEELKLTLHNEYENKLNTQENQLTSKYLQDLEKEKLTYKSNIQSEEDIRTQHAITLAKVQWDDEKSQQLNMALKTERAKWENARAIENAEIEARIQKVKEECMHQQKVRHSRRINMGEISLFCN